MRKWRQLHTIAVISSAWRWNITGLILSVALLILFARTGWFLAGVALFATIVCSPLDLLAREYLFTAYAIEQMLIGLVIPYFLVRGMRSKGVRISMYAAWAVGMVSLSIWFLPGLLNASLTSEGARAAEFAMLIAGGAVFWWPIHSRYKENRIPLVPNTLLYLAAATVWCSLLGLVLAFEKPLLIARYVQPRDPLHIADSLLIDWSFSRENDQQTAGLLFWIAAASVLLSEVMFTYYRWYKSPEVQNE